MKTLVILNQDAMGHGDAELGRKMLKTCLQKLANLPGLDALAFYNSGVRLAASDSPVAAELKMLAERGVDLLACATCVEHFGLTGRLVVEQPSNMVEILDAIHKADKVVTL